MVLAAVGKGPDQTHACPEGTFSLGAAQLYWLAKKVYPSFQDQSTDFPTRFYFGVKEKKAHFLNGTILFQLYVQDWDADLRTWTKKSKTCCASSIGELKKKTKTKKNKKKNKTDRLIQIKSLIPICFIGTIPDTYHSANDKLCCLENILYSRKSDFICLYVQSFFPPIPCLANVQSIITKTRLYKYI